MIFILLLYILYTNSQCPRYSLAKNPNPFLSSINLPVLSTSRSPYKDKWPTKIIVQCSSASKSSTAITWYNSLQTDYSVGNESAIIDLNLVSPDLKIRERPTCLMWNNHHSCFIGTTFPLYLPQISLILDDDETVEACGNQQFALRVVDVPANVAPFVMWRLDVSTCNIPNSMFLYDTIYIDQFDASASLLACTVFGYTFSYKIKQVTSSPNCLGSKSRIMFPRNNDVMYYYEHKFYYEDNIFTVIYPNIICLPLRLNTRLLDSKGKMVNSFAGLQGKHQFSCEILGDASSKVTFFIVFPKPPAITVPLKDCIRCDNKCTFSFDYYAGDSVDPVVIKWFYNGEELEEGLFAKFSSDRKSVDFLVFENTGGNIQATISNSYGTQMTSAYVLYTAPPFFEVDLPRFGSISGSTTIIAAKVNFKGKDEVKMWWKMNGKVLNTSVKHLTATVNTVNHTCTLELKYNAQDPVVGSFSCVFQAGSSCIIETTKCDFSTTEKIRDTVSLMIPVLGVLGAAVLLAIVLIPLCVVYRNRHSKAYRLALVERECGLNPEKDFHTINDFGENSRRQARNNAHFSILPSAPGSNDGSVVPFNNMPDIKEQASFINDYQP